MWTGEVVLVRRNYDLKDEEQPFSMKFIAALIMRERKLVRDIAICALIFQFHGAGADHVLASDPARRCSPTRR